MGQTLTNGIYLPAEGERNCYAGLEGNWRSLDGLISTVAGKASASHTHGNISNDGKLATANRVLITDGNKVISLSGVTDTELSYLSGVTSAIQTQLNAKAADSDVVHKSGNETVGGVKTFSSLIKQSDAFSGTYTDVYQLVDSNNYRIVSFRAVKGTTNNTLGIYVHDQNNSAPKGLIIGNDLSNNISIAGSGTNNYLGTSSNHWTAIYADSYYYGTTAWGLDKANVWTNRQTYKVYLKSFGETRTDEWSTNSRTNAYLLSRRDTDDVSGFLISTFRQNAEQGIAGHIYGWDILENSTRYSGLRFAIEWDNTLNSGNGAYKVTLTTNTQGTNPCNDLHITQLKTINGINPGALSLPNGSDNDTSWTGDLTILDGSNNNEKTFLKDGWVTINIPGTAGNFILVNNGQGQIVSNVGTGTQNNCAVMFPVRANIKVYIQIKIQTGEQVKHAIWTGCAGNI